MRNDCGFTINRGRVSAGNSSFPFRRYPPKVPRTLIPFPRGRFANSVQGNKVSCKQDLKLNLNFYDEK